MKAATIFVIDQQKLISFEAEKFEIYQLIHLLGLFTSFFTTYLINPWFDFRQII